MDGSTATSYNKTLDRICKVIEDGSFYEGQQMLKASFYRFKGKKMHEHSYKILEDGALMQFEHRQTTCGLELGILLVQAFMTDNIPPTEETSEQIVRIIMALPAELGVQQWEEGYNKTAVEESTRMVTMAVKWAHKQQSPDSARKFHNAYAERLWQNYSWHCLSLISANFIRGEEFTRHAYVLSQCASLCNPGEADLFVARAVLNTLCMRINQADDSTAQIKRAKLLMDACRVTFAVEDLDTPLMRFLDMFLEALQRSSQPLVRYLEERYAPSLKRDPSLVILIASIHKKVFKAAGGGGGLSGLLSSLLSGLNE